MKQSRIRVLVGAGSFIDAQAGLRIAGRLAEDMLADLGGLLIQEADIIATYRIPNQRVVSASGAIIMAPSPAQVRTLMNADANAFRKLLADVAHPPPAGWKFEQQSGDLIERSIKVGREWDVLIIGHRDIHSVAGNVIFLGTPSSDEDRAMSLSATLSDRLDAKLEIYSVGGANALPTQAHCFQFDTLDAALSQLARANAQAVVIDLMRGPVRNHNQLRALLDMARCPVIILGAPTLEPVLENSIHIPPVQKNGPE